MKQRISLFLLTIICYSCGLTPKKISLDDPELQPLLEAIKEVNRDTLGFTEIDKDAEIRIEGGSGLFEKPYHKMLHIYGKTSRTIAFKKLGSGKYVWIGEQETFTGPVEYETVDGKMNEEIVITYDKILISGTPPNTLDIKYSGPKKVLSENYDLKLKDVKPFIEKWQANQ